MDDATLQAAVRRHIARDGLNLTEAAMLRRAVLGTLPKEPTNAQAVAMAVLVNAGLLELGPPPGRTSRPPRVPGDDVRFSLCLDEELPVR